uniref:BZIP domain-containing protein n=1 Tax=Kalanchoe fedtschenkoi TaxID=63787 RepID=A0A7N0UZ68_KALFE
MRSISGSTTFSSASHSDGDDGQRKRLAHGADPMVKSEMEAAEALAGLAHVARESSDSGTTKWGSKGKRARSRVKSESPQLDSPDLALVSSNYQTTMEYDGIEEMDVHAGFRNEKVKQQAKLLSPSLMCDASTKYFGGGRSRKNLTEAEKEEKRLRRVLANRESARQTIRRRQALHEELSRKASDLSMENADLKREKELALEKLRSLKAANDLLKAQSVKPVREENFLQVVQNVKPKVEENLLQMSLNIKPDDEENLELKLAHPGASSPRNTSRPYCNNTQTKRSQLTPCLLPPIVQSLSMDKSAHMPCVAMPTTLPIFAPGLNSSDQKPYTLGSPLTPVYILPYPWFLPVPYHHDGEAHHEPPGGADEGKHNNTITVSSPCNGSFKGTLVDSQFSALPLKAKAEVSCSKENGHGPGTSSSGTPFLHMIDGTGTGVFGAHASGSVRIPSPSTSNPSHVSPDAKTEQWFSQDASQSESRSICSVAQANKETALFFPIKMTDHTVAAAEARKRRKELTRFKNFPGRQCRLPC